MKIIINFTGVFLIVITIACTPKQPLSDLPYEVKTYSHLINRDHNISYRDLNKNGKLDVYEDSNQSIEDRVQDLLKQMTLEEKAGTMFYPPVQVNRDGTIEEQSTDDLLASISFVGINEMKNHHITHFNLFTVYSPDTLAIWYNRMQQYAENTRLGIPLTIASDPRNQAEGGFYSQAAKNFSVWPDPLGLAAIGDENIVRQFADISRQEYISVGIRQALHPQVDLATEPRWPRISGTFGEDAKLTSRLTKAYINGYQGETTGVKSVACMTKHFPGGGPQKEGLDPHFEFQKGQVYPGNNFNYHLIPFEAAFEVKTAAIMPYYGVPMGQGIEEVGFSYNKAIIKELLRGKYKYDGVVCTDWSLVSDGNFGPIAIKAKAWGAEELNTEERVQKIIDAGVDQFGGEILTEVIVKLVEDDKITEARIDSSVVRLLRLKFQLGLFDNPFVDENKTNQIIGNQEFMEAGKEAQRKSFTLLKNENNFLPLEINKFKIYIKNISPDIAANYGTVVDDPKEADIAIIRLETPHYQIPETKDNIIASSMFHFGDLDFKDKELIDILKLEKTVPTVVDIYIDRPAVIPEIAAVSKGLFASFGSDDEAFLDVVFGKAKPEGHLPIELPSSMKAVVNQKEDLPYDSKDPLFPFGAGLSYE